MKVISKINAMKVLSESLFKPINGHTLNKRKFDCGKYQWKGQKYYMGREVQDIKGIHAVYVERRQDKEGPYAQLMCISEF